MSVVYSDEGFLGRMFGSEWANRLVMPLPFGDDAPQNVPNLSHLSTQAQEEQQQQQEEEEDDEEQVISQRTKKRHRDETQTSMAQDDDIEDINNDMDNDDDQSNVVVVKEDNGVDDGMDVEGTAVAVIVEDEARATTTIATNTATTNTSTTTGIAEKVSVVEDVPIPTSVPRHRSPSPTVVILERRQRQREEHHTLLQSIMVSIPKEFSSNSKSKDDDEAETRTRILRSFTKNADTILRQQGVVLLKKEGHVFPRKLLTWLRQGATVIQNAVIHRLDEIGKVWSSLQVIQVENVDVDIDDNNYDDHDDDDDDYNNKYKRRNSTIKSHSDQRYSFAYQEVASRYLGRLDIRYGMDHPPFHTPDVLQNPWLMPLIHSVLGDSAKLVYSGLILSFPGSVDQPWHQDGNALFPELVESDNENVQDLPPYALNVFIPLTPIESSLGPTEFWVASHKESNWKQVQEMLSNPLADDDATFPSLTNKDDVTGMVAPTLSKGDVLIYDYRICHRGTANISTTAVRPMLYLMYARPWFAEQFHFGSEYLFATPPTTLLADVRPPKLDGMAWKKAKR